MLAKIEQIKQLNSDTFSIYFKPDNEFSYLAGQYTEISFPHEHKDFIGDNRWFTLSSSPSEEYLSITIRARKPLSNFKRELLSLKKNDEIIISEPIGDYVLPKDKTIPIVLICGGIGITPARSVIKWLTDKKEARDIILIHFVRDKESLLFSDIFQKYDMSYEPVITSIHPRESTLADKIIKFKSNSLFFVSGPQTMVESITKDLRAKFGNEQVIMDYFPGYTSI